MAMHQDFNRKQDDWRPRRSSVTLRGVLILAGVVAAAVIAFNVSFGGGVLAFGFALFALWLHANSVEPGKFRGGIAGVFLAASVVIAVLSVIPVYTAHVLSFTFAGWLTWGLYGASLVLGLLSRLDNAERFFALLLAIAIPVALVVMPVPAESFAPGDESQNWSVELTVRDSEGRPVPGAHAACGAMMRWDVEKAQRRHWGMDFAAATDAEGRAAFTFNEDPRLKAVLCTAIRVIPDPPGSLLPPRTVGRPGLTAGIAPPLGLRLDLAITLPDEEDEAGQPRP